MLTSCILLPRTRSLQNHASHTKTPAPYRIISLPPSCRPTKVTYNRLKECSGQSAINVTMSLFSQSLLLSNIVFICLPPLARASRFGCPSKVPLLLCSINWNKNDPSLGPAAKSVPLVTDETKIYRLAIVLAWHGFLSPHCCLLFFVWICRLQKITQ